MLVYQGSDVYLFHNEFNHPITLTKNDINTICELAIKDDSFDIGKEVQKLADESEHWQEINDELRDNFEQFKDDILNLINRKK